MVLSLRLVESWCHRHIDNQNDGRHDLCTYCSMQRRWPLRLATSRAPARWTLSPPSRRNPAWTQSFPRSVSPRISGITKEPDRRSSHPRCVCVWNRYRYWYGRYWQVDYTRWDRIQRQSLVAFIEITVQNIGYDDYFDHLLLTVSSW